MPRLGLLFSLLVATTALCSHAAHADFEAAKQAYMQQDYATARKELDQSTLDEEPAALILLGMMERDGKGGPANPASAFVDISLGGMRAEGQEFWNVALRERGLAAAKMSKEEVQAAEQRVALVIRGEMSNLALEKKIMELHSTLKACNSNCESAAEKAFRLGPNAKDLIPDLEALMTRDPMWMPRLVYALALGSIGTEAVPALERIMLDRRQLETEGPWNLQSAAMTIGLMGAVASAARPSLLNALFGSADVSRGEFNDLFTVLTNRPPEAQLNEARVQVAVAFAGVGDPDRTFYAELANARGQVNDPVVSLLAAMAMAMTYAEYDPFMETVESALKGSIPAGQSFALQILPLLSETPETRSRTQSLTPAVRKLAETTDPAVQEAARKALEDATQEARWEASDLLESNNFKAALDQLNSVLEINPWSAAALKLRAEAKRGSGDIVGSLRDYKDSMALPGGAYSIQFMLRDAGAITEEQVSGEPDELTIRSLEKCIKDDACFETMRRSR